MPSAVQLNLMCNNLARNTRGALKPIWSRMQRQMPSYQREAIRTLATRLRCLSTLLPSCLAWLLQLNSIPHPLPSMSTRSPICFKSHSNSKIVSHRCGRRRSGGGGTRIKPASAYSALQLTAWPSQHAATSLTTTFIEFAKLAVFHFLPFFHLQAM